MKRWIKIVTILIAVVVLLIVVGAIGVYLSLGKAVPAGVAKFGPEVTGTPVNLGGFDLSLLRGKLELKDLVVGNPEGFQTDHAFRLGTVLVRLDPTSVLGDTIHVREVRIEAPEITWEMSTHGSNIGMIKKHAESLAAPAKEGEEKPPAPEKKPPAEKKPGKKVIIDDFVLTGGKVSVSATFAGGRKISLPLPTIHLKDIGKDSGGKSIPEVLSDVVAKVTQVVTETARSGIGVGKESVGAAAEAAKQTGETLKKQASGAVDAVKGLFGRKR